MKRIWIAIFVLFASCAPAQNLSTAGNITLQASSCAGAGAGYVYYQLPSNAASVGIAIAGTWSGSVQFAGSVNVIGNVQ